MLVSTASSLFEQPLDVPSGVCRCTCHVSAAALAAVLDLSDLLLSMTLKALISLPLLLLQVCDEGQRERLLSRVRCYYEILKTSQFGKHIVNRLEKLLSAGMRIQVNSLNNSSPVPPVQVPMPSVPGVPVLQQQQPAIAAASVDPAAADCSLAVGEDQQFVS